MLKRDDCKEKYGPWAVVAGASEGLGLAFAEKLAALGMNLILIARRREILQEAGESLSSRFGIEIDPVQMDLGDQEALLSWLDSESRDIGLLVYNAAYAPVSEFTNLTQDQIKTVTRVNILAPSLMAHHFSRKMKEQGRGGVILMSSLAGFQGSPFLPVYGASKAYNTVLGESLWRELKESNVDVTVCCAGAVRTPGYKQAGSGREAPGTMDAAAVAEAALKSLGRKPLVVPGIQNRFFRFILGRVLSRKAAVNLMYIQTRDLS